MIARQTSPEITTNGTVVLSLNKKDSTGNNNTRHTLQIIDGGVPSTAGTITINAKVNSGHANATYQLIGTFDCTAKAPIFIEGSYEELQFVGATMTATSSAFIAVVSTR